MGQEATTIVKIDALVAKPVVELWDRLSESERAEFQKVALKLRDSMVTAKTAEEAHSRALVVIEQQSVQENSHILEYLGEYLAVMRQHAWDDRTWAQRLVILSLIASLPLSGHAAGLAAFGTAVRVAIPVVGAAAAALLGSGLELASDLLPAARDLYKRYKERA
jgi:hypothetical protein